MINPAFSKDIRRRAWYHNSLLGRTMFAQKAMQEIAQATTCTEAAKRKAEIIISQLLELKEALKERVD